MTSKRFQDRRGSVSQVTYFSGTVTRERTTLTFPIRGILPDGRDNVVTTPISLASMRELFNYNYWARDCQLQACAALSEEQFSRGLSSSFSSVRDTLVHLLVTEQVWLERWQSRSSEPVPPPEEFSSLDAVSERWRGIEVEMRKYLASLEEETLAQPVSYMSQKGDRFTYELWRLMFHLINHQSYHRGQVATLLRQLNVQPPGVDFLPGYRAGFATL